jgi:hypothetical protein
MLGELLLSQVTDSSAPERRRGHRFPLHLACRVTLPFRKSRELPGTTTDISRSGVKVVFENVGGSDELPAVGESASILIDLPHTPSISPRCLECRGVMVRTEVLEPQRLAAAFEIRRIGVCDRSGQSSQPSDSLLAGLVPHGPIQ